MNARSDKPEADAVPSATAVLLRERNQQLEVLMLQKTAKINYGGSWVFPGGVCDPEDYQRAEQEWPDASLENVAKVTACRETIEEAGIEFQPQQLSAFAHWTTPKIKLKRRYATWFFVADARDIAQQVVIDHGEIVQAQWFKPSEALELHAQQKIILNGPSFVSLTQLAQLNTVDAALSQYRGQMPEYFKPRGHMLDDGVLTLYQDDSDYLNELPHSDTPQQAHRLYMFKKAPWQYHRS